jgi:integrase
MPQTAVLRAFVARLDQQTPQRKVLGLAAQFAALAGSRQVEFLDLSWMQVDRAAGMVRMKRAKQRGKKRGEVIEAVRITPRLAALLDAVAALNRDCLYLFPDRDNNAYSSHAFKTLWCRCVNAAIRAGVMRASDRFNFHALRRYYTTMHKDEYGKLPDLHADAAVTARGYDGTRVVRRDAL